ncbi:armadillo-type fold protein, partial [Tanacetum coccineum]
ASISTSDVTTDNDEDPNSKSLSALQTTDYSNLFGEEFRVTDDHWDFRYLQLLDIKAVEEGILHVLFACASQPLLCSKLAENSSEFWSTLPLVQALLPGIKREYSNARTPQQNGVAKKKNRTLIEAARTMLADSFLPNTFWAEAVSTACYVLNRVLVTKPHNKTPCELFTGQGRMNLLKTALYCQYGLLILQQSILFVHVSPHEGLSLLDPTNTEQDDSEYTLLEDIYQNSIDGIFTNSSYDDEGAVADFTNLETIVNVIPIPTSRIISSHPSALILGDPTPQQFKQEAVKKVRDTESLDTYRSAFWEEGYWHKAD